MNLLQILSRLNKAKKNESRAMRQMIQESILPFKPLQSSEKEAEQTEEDKLKKILFGQSSGSSASDQKQNGMLTNAQKLLQGDFKILKAHYIIMLIVYEFKFLDSSDFKIFVLISDFGYSGYVEILCIQCKFFFNYSFTRSFVKRKNQFYFAVLVKILNF